MTGPGPWAVTASKIYPKGSDSERFLERIRTDSWLVNIIHHDFVDGHGLWDLLLE